MTDDVGYLKLPLFLSSFFVFSVKSISFADRLALPFESSSPAVFR
ncbi:unnamed protein product [Arabidopsis halleri]